ncbi:LamG domain-containing protein [Bacteroidota bacterium]
MNRFSLYLFIFIYPVLLLGQNLDSGYSVTALWLFDEQVGYYPSHVLEDNSESNIPLVLGLGGQIVPGRFGNALDPVKQDRIELPKGEIEFGLKYLPAPQGRTVQPLTWHNAKFAAVMISGENHLRKEIGFKKPTETKLNLGDFDFTVEFWFQISHPTKQDGIVFEIGTGPRGENDIVTNMKLNMDLDSFTIYNHSSGNTAVLDTKLEMNKWHHIAFTYESAKHEIKHYVDGKLLSLQRFRIKLLPVGDEDYMCIGRDRSWNRPLQGKIDELRFSKGLVYKTEFEVPKSFAPPMKQEKLISGPPLLFSYDQHPIRLEDRKHLFIDDALLEKMEDVEFVVNPPRKEEVILTGIEGQFRKHLTVVEDKEGRIRIYNSAHDDYLQVHISDDGVNFSKPELGKEFRGQRNFVIHEPVGGLGNPFIDPNGSGDTKWKYITGYHSRGTYLYTSPDGLKWQRHKTALIPFRNGTQSCTFYDDQRQMYVSYHRTGIHHTPGLATERASVITQTQDLFHPIKFKPLTQQDYRNIDKSKRIREPLPWWLDNGPLTPGDWGLEFPVKFQPGKEDPVGTDLYITKAIKYPWAPDTYFAFPIVYFHYYQDGPITRHELENPERQRGSGPIETQIAVSRNGLDWKRLYRPAYIGIGKHGGIDIKTAYIAQGMIKRSNEIWQYYFGEPHYHSAHKKQDEKRAVFRLVQRMDGFISIDSPYDKEAYVTTKPFIFRGDRLVLNIDTDAAGYAQVGFLDENDNQIKGFSLDDCVYINGDFIETEIEWIKNRGEFLELSEQDAESEFTSSKIKTGKDVSELEGKTVKLIFRLRGTKLYSMQFKQSN